MSNMIKNKVDKVVGSVKETIGRSVDSDQLELKGKVQKTKGEVSEKVSWAIENAKETLAESANKVIDIVKDKK